MGMMTAMPAIPLSVGAGRVIRGVRVPHVCGDPALSEEQDHKLRVRIVEAALESLATAVSAPTLFEPSETSAKEVMA